MCSGGLLLRSSTVYLNRVVMRRAVAFHNTVRRFDECYHRAAGFERILDVNSYI